MKGDRSGMTINHNRLSGLFKRSGILTMAAGVLSLLLAFGNANPAMADGSQDPAPKTEFRGAWIATVSNIDWPSNRYTSQETQKQELVSVLDRLQEIGINAVVFQVKPSADALYPSDILPWSEWLTGTQGTDPGYDPLQFVIEEAHKRNMEFHAWFNPFRANTRPNMNGMTADHPIREMAEGWVVPYGSGLYLNPGIEGVRQFATETIIEVVKKYDIDGVHIDDYFYPYPVGEEQFDDEAAYQAYGTGFGNKGDWRRSNVNTFVEQLYMQIKAEKPSVQFGISPFGIWRNASTDPTGSATNGLQSYDAVYADSRSWIQNKWIDYIAPQIYWSTEMAVADYDVLVEWWANEVKDSGVDLYIGQAAYKIANNSDNQWQQPDELIKQIRYNRMFDEVKGGIFYSSKPLLANPLNILNQLKETVFRYPAMIPAKASGASPMPEVPEDVRAEQKQEGVLVTWEDSGNANAYYVVYRMDGQGMPDLADPSSIAAFVRKSDGGTTHSFLDTAADAEKTTGYVVTAANRLHHESVPSAPAMIMEAPDVVAGDANGDGAISIGDLSMMASLQDKNDSDPDWAEIAHLDLDGNRTIDLDDIRLVARLILEN
ncbi:family 10 glycosylhydrolase [Paenibacillus agaridevorans]|uniref:family 10 glycosylhydrolase n=1 Tax=Paenibacillus agaridevorans TaxID=171404 RepID=UPI001FE6CDA5|nr:family 10 glycosylhydrolase [Paenibacillus agaridevorans]